MYKAPLRVIVVEDHREVREHLRAALQRQPDIRVVGSYPNGDDYLEALSTVETDVVIMDIHMPGRSGIECISIAKPKLPHVQFMVFTVFENAAYIFQALCAGATGYVLKNAEDEELLDAVRMIASGGSPMSPAIARLVVTSFQKPVVEKINNELLTERERQIVDQMAKGLLYKEIGAQLGISGETVRKHARSIYSKLQVNTRLEAIRKVYPGQ